MTQNPQPQSEEALRKALLVILDDLQDYWLDPERYATPMKIGDSTFEDQIMSLFQEQKAASERLARIDELKRLRNFKAPYYMKGNSESTATCIYSYRLDDRIAALQNQQATEAGDKQ